VLLFSIKVLETQLKKEFILEIGKGSSTTESIESTTVSQRLLSLDVLRGFDMFFIIGGGVILKKLSALFGDDFHLAIKQQLSHANWVGLTVEDMIMPLFMFITGCSMVFSFDKRLKIDGLKKVYLHVFQRFSILWFLGMIYQGRLLNLNWEDTRFFSNTLQAIAIGYLACSFILLLKKLHWQIISVIGLLLSYTLLSHFYPVPNFGAGNFSVEGNLAAYVDNLIMGSHRDGKKYTWILSSLNFTVTVMLGVFSGRLLKNKSILDKQKVLRLLIYGLSTLGAGYSLSLIDPCIKKIWTSSFTLISGAYCILLLTLFYYIIDVVKFRKGLLFFSVIGANAIFVYMFHRFFKSEAFMHQFLLGLEQFVNSEELKLYPLIKSIAGLGLTWSILYFMYLKKIFIKV